FLAPAGTSLAQTEALAGRVDDVLRASPFVRAFSREIGAQLGPPAATQPFQGDMQVRLRAADRPDFEAIAEAQREALAKAVPQLHVEFSQVLEDTLSDLEGQPEPIEVKLFGADEAKLRALGQEVARRIRDVPGIADLFDGDYGCAPQLDVGVDSVAAGRVGLTAEGVAAQVRDAEAGDVVGRVPYEDRLIDVRLRLTDAARYRPDALETLRLRPASGPDIPLSSVAKVTPRCPPASLLSENLRRMLAVTARLEGGNLGAVAAEVTRWLAGLPLPPGSSWELGGQALSQRRSFQELLSALGLAVFGLCALLAFHFASLRLSLLVLGTIPVALACGALSLFAVGVPLNVSSLLGGLVLAGLIVKNGVLLIDQAEASRRQGLGKREALLEAASRRLRPIAMTTLATLLGLLPLALGLGAGADIQRPLAVTVLGGLAVSSLVTLFALPSVYLLL
ncbi:MAG: efflux RND transporter permease subunit, partial [Deltaproteobacteria bacterium]